MVKVDDDHDHVRYQQLLRHETKAKIDTGTATHLKFSVCLVYSEYASEPGKIDGIFSPEVSIAEGHAMLLQSWRPIRAGEQIL
jgi:hypothetical protein